MGCTFCHHWRRLCDWLGLWGEPAPEHDCLYKREARA